MSGKDKVNILMVDDQPRNLLALEAVLADLDERLIKAHSGSEALKILFDEEVAVTLLDVQMPVMDGFETAKLIRARDRSKDTPIIFVTAIHKDESHVFEGYSFGAVDYIFKPIVPHMLFSKVAVFVELFRKRQDIWKLNAKLEQRVKERTAELAAANRDLKAAQAQLVQAGKLAALGELGAGIAHELNQPITAIRTFAEMFGREDPAMNPQQLDRVERIVKATQRMSRIVDNVRTFARQSELRLEAIPAIKPLDDALQLLSEQLRLHEVEIEHVVDDALPEVLADGIQLQQVFLNLLANARDALDVNEAGIPKRLCLSVRAHDGRVVYAVEDNGPGVSEGDTQRVFDPFFTTKATGKGMGLGLSLSYGIIKNHAGEIRLERPVNGGVRFVVEIPAAPSRGDRPDSQGVSG